MKQLILRNFLLFSFKCQTFKKKFFCSRFDWNATREPDSININQISAFCKSSLDHVQLSYLRATHKFDFFILFMSIWMDILTLICACGALTRTLSICLDAMTGGMARIYILGRNAPENEPWPDVIGFSIIFILSVMFMLGLEVIIRHNYLMIFSGSNRQTN